MAGPARKVTSWVWTGYRRAVPFCPFGLLFFLGLGRNGVEFPRIYSHFLRIGIGGALHGARPSTLLR